MEKKQARKPRIRTQARDKQKVQVIVACPNQCSSCRCP